ncbi:MAG: holo-ACP synthase [Candidatus Eremiobacteraeota bacterium]|nr:holo-ACP synthase [Candidatus Eremiobacteraeota bacterium]MBC5826566.1 holo-ACP synthase [Candidatus Eremiobacteraeota bacterium]
MIVGLGTDVVDVARFKFDATKMERFASKIFTDTEMAYARSRHQAAQHLAAAFAVKEATRKAFGDPIPWRLIGVRHEPSGRPYIELRGSAQALVGARGVRRMHLTIAHTRNSALATVLLESDDAVGGLSSVPPEFDEVAAR